MNLSSERMQRRLQRESNPWKTFLFASAFIAMLATIGCQKQQAAQKMPPPEVEVTKVVQQDMPVNGDWVGNLDGYVNVQIQPQVTGYLLKQNYREGDFVRKDQVLYEIDERPFQAILDQALGQLAQSKASLSLANINLERDKPLAAERAVSQSQLDNDVQQQEAADASVKSAQAMVWQAQLNVGFTRVRCLIDGIAGQAQTQVGNLVTPSTTLTSVSQVNPIKAYFAISEQEYLDLSKRTKTHGHTDLLHSGDDVPLQLTLANEDVYPQHGKIIFVDRQVSTDTGTIRIAAAFPNPGNLLRPGQFARIQARTDTKRGALLVPQRAVSEVQGNYQVVVVTAGNVAKITPVKLGRQIGTQWEVTSGLEPGQQVITEGLFKVRDGVPVSVKQAAAQTPSPSPTAPAPPGAR